MKFPKKYDVEHGDSVTVETYGPDSIGEVELTVKDSGRDAGILLFVKPGKARKIAKALLKAANVAEGLEQDADEPTLPALLIDDDGDAWHLDENGETYTYATDDELSPRYHASIMGQTRESIADRFGIRTEARTR